MVTIQAQLKKQGRESKALTWPPNSSDPSLVDHSRDIMEPWMEQKPYPPHHKTQEIHSERTRSRNTTPPQRSPAHQLTDQMSHDSVRGTNTQFSRCSCVICVYSKELQLNEYRQQCSVKEKWVRLFYQSTGSILEALFSAKFCNETCSRCSNLCLWIWPWDYLWSPVKRV